MAAAQFQKGYAIRPQQETHQHQVPRIRSAPNWAQKKPVLPPTCSPMGVIDNSAPMEKKIIPRITSTDPTRNSTRMPGDNAATVKPSIKTISTMGITALMDSLAFSLAFSFKTD